MTYGYNVRFKKKIERTLFREKCESEGVSGSSILTQAAGKYVMGTLGIKGEKISDINKRNRIVLDKGDTTVVN